MRRGREREGRYRRAAAPWVFACVAALCCATVSDAAAQSRAASAQGPTACAREPSRTGEPRLRGPWLFDAEVRDALRLDDPAARADADALSDAGLLLLISYPFADALLAATVLDRRPYVPVAIAARSMLVLSTTALVTYSTKVLFARERPYGSDCTRAGPTGGECDDGGRAASFFSGHAAIAFAAATLGCVQHLEFELYGSTGADAAACATGLTVAAAVSVLRIVADQHYATDVLAGAAAGVLSGLGLGLFLHY